MGYRMLAVLGAGVVWVHSLCSSAIAQSGSGDSAIYPKPEAPSLPSAGGAYVDPTFGTTITRVTDASSAPDGAGVNSAALDSMFNADGSLFYAHHVNDGTYLYSVDKATGQIRLEGKLQDYLVSYDGAAWDPRFHPGVDPF
jgi:hypothetical protein